jgi:hypothetical protein
MIRLMLAAFVLSSAAVVHAANPGNPTGKPGSKFATKHPARNKDNKRVANQRKRIDQGVKNGTMTKGQAAADRKNLDGIKAQEHADVKANGGHLTGAEQKQINGELNANSKEIHEQKNPQ